jgi:hypothetical protein
LGLSYRYKAVFLRPSLVFDAKSTIPDTGFITKPVNPFPIPFNKPTAPPFFVSYIGFVIIPVNPSLNP